MSGKIHFLALVMGAALVTAGLAGCRGSGTGLAASTSSASVSPTPAPTSTAPTQADVGFAMSGSVGVATSFHVAGEYTYPHARLALNVGLLKSGSMAGTLVDNGEPIVATYVGGKMYTKVTRDFLAYLGKSRECARICGQYVLARPDLAHGLLASMGMAVTESILQDMAAAGPTMTSVTYDGQPAYEWSPADYAAGSYIVVGPLPQCLPLKVDLPGQFVLTFSQWNQVPAPVAPRASKIHKGPW
jgi:hypothetical protein